MKPLLFFALIRHVFSLNFFRLAAKRAAIVSVSALRSPMYSAWLFSCAGISFFAISRDKGNGALCFLRRKEPLAFVKLLQAVCNSRPDFAV